MNQDVPRGGGRARYVYAVCNKKTGAFCKSFPAWKPVFYAYRRDAKDDCPDYAEVVTFKEIRK